MKKILLGVIIVGILGCSLVMVVRQNSSFNDEITKEEIIKEEVGEKENKQKRPKDTKDEFIKNEEIDISGLVELNRVQADLNSDGRKEELIEMGREGGKEMEIEDGLILIKEGENISALTRGNLAIGVQEIIDMDEDGIKEVLVDIRMGGNMPNTSSLYRYNQEKKCYTRVNTILPDLEAKLTDRFRVRVVERNTMTYVEKDIEYRYRENIKYRYDELDQIIGEKSQMIGYGTASVYDYNGDGILDYTERVHIAGEAKAETILMLDVIHEYKEGETRLLGIVAKEDTGTKDTKIKKIEEENKEVPKKDEKLSEEERKKKAVQTLYDKGILDIKYDTAQIFEITGNPFNRYKGRYYQIMATNVGYDHAMCYLVNKNDFSILVGWSDGYTMTETEYYEFISK